MSSPMKCPACGATMNHHADKLIYTDAGEHVEEFHQCPECGATASRTADRQIPLS
jgi:rubrerythrin